MTWALLVFQVCTVLCSFSMAPFGNSAPSFGISWFLSPSQLSFLHFSLLKCELLHFIHSFKTEYLFPLSNLFGTISARVTFLLLLTFKINCLKIIFAFSGFCSSTHFFNALFEIHVNGLEVIT